MLNNIINQNYEMHNWKEFVALLIKSYECVPLRLLATKGSLRSSGQET